MTSVAEVVKAHQISEILHFTTNRGLTGILAEKAVLSRQRLPESKYLEHVYRPNAATRKDRAYLDFVNLSITRINTRFFGSSRRWHQNEDIWWCAVAFTPEILSHDGVEFATTNNMYTGCLRASGGDGLEALFADRIHQYAGVYVNRPADMPVDWATCRQAEVLYPKLVTCEHLSAIYVATGAHADIAASSRDILLETDRVPVIVRPDVFEP